jgi:hypothetical protein
MRATMKDNMPKKKPTPKTAKLTVNKQVVTDLASCVLWALKFLQTPHGGGLWLNMTTMESKAWEDRFMDALDSVGHHIDRKAFWKKRDLEEASWKKRDEKKKRPRARIPASKAHAPARS